MYGLFWGIREASGCRVSGVYLGLAGTLGTQGPEGYKRHQGELETPRGCRDCFGVSRRHQGVGVSGVYWGLTGTLGV